MASSRSSSAADAPCHATGTTRLDGPARMAPRALPHSRCAHSARFRDPRAPSIAESPGEHALSRTPSGGRHCYPCLAASAQLPGTLFAVTSCPLDPPSLGSSPRSNRAACRSSTSAVEMILEHTSGRTKLRHSRDGKPPQVGRQQRPRTHPAPRLRTEPSTGPRTPPTAGLSTGQGPALPSGRAFGNSPERPLAQNEIDPDPIDPDTRVAFP
jgi:hypothetical protein